MSFCRKLVPLRLCARNFLNNSNQSRNVGLWRRPDGWFDQTPWDRWANNRFEMMDKEFERLFGSSLLNPGRFIRATFPERVEDWFKLHSPIVEEDGVKKFKIAFDMHKFKPEEVTVKTKEGKVSIEAKHESAEDELSQKFHFHQEFAVPEGVKANEVSCKYMDDGTMVLEAPYTEPPEVPKLPKEQEIPVKHE